MHYSKRSSRQRLARAGLPAAALVLAFVVLGIAVAPAGADFPFKGTGGDASNAYAYQNYMYMTPAQFPPSDLGGDIWKYSSKNACQIYGNVNQSCDPSVTNNAQELHGVTGASIDKAWQTTTGRSDVIIAVHDSGIKWNDDGAMTDLVNKT